MEGHALNKGADAMAIKGVNTHVEDAVLQASHGWGTHRARQHWLSTRTMAGAAGSDSLATGGGSEELTEKRTDRRRLEPATSALHMGPPQGTKAQWQALSCNRASSRTLPIEQALQGRALARMYADKTQMHTMTASAFIPTGPANQPRRGIGPPVPLCNYVS